MHIYKNDFGQSVFVRVPLGHRNGFSWTPGKRERVGRTCAGTFPHRFDGYDATNCDACFNSLPRALRAVVNFKRWIERTFGDR